MWWQERKGNHRENTWPKRRTKNRQIPYAKFRKKHHHCAAGAGKRTTRMAGMLKSGLLARTEATPLVELRPRVSPGHACNRRLPLPFSQKHHLIYLDIRLRKRTGHKTEPLTCFFSSHLIKNVVHSLWYVSQMVQLQTYPGLKNLQSQRCQ